MKTGRIRQFFQSVGRKFFADHSPIETDISIHRLVNKNHLNKRRTTRIKYPHLGSIEPFPQVFYANFELNVDNISVGGLLIIDDTDQFGGDIGDILPLDIRWSDFSIRVRGRIVGVQSQKRHIQFVDFDAQLYLRISHIVNVGQLGHGFHIVRNESGSLQADEMWLSTTGDSIVFFKNDPMPEITLSKEKINFADLSLGRTRDLIALFANFQSLTPRVKQVLEVLHKTNSIVENSNRADGTHG